MPFIRGRYYMNPVAGEAIEAARAAEEALREAGSGDDGGDSEGEDQYGGDGDAESSGPIHRIEIEATELVPSATGRASRGFVARVHRGDSAGDRDARLGGVAPRNARPAGLKASARPETHVFSDHRDLVSFLGDALGK